MFRYLHGVLLESNYPLVAVAKQITDRTTLSTSHALALVQALILQNVLYISDGMVGLATNAPRLLRMDDEFLTNSVEAFTQGAAGEIRPDAIRSTGYGALMIQPSIGHELGATDPFAWSKVALFVQLNDERSPWPACDLRDLIGFKIKDSKVTVTFLLPEDTPPEGLLERLLEVQTEQALERQRRLLSPKS